MKIVVHHLTRMERGYFCVAGIDLETGKDIRPVIQGRLPISLLHTRGGIFDMAGIVDLGKVEYYGRKPQTEDYFFHPNEARYISPYPPEKFWKLIEDTSLDSFRGIFGEQLKDIGTRGCGFEEHKGEHSLGCLFPARKPKLYVKEREGKPPQVRATVRDADREYDLGVTDIRLYGSDHVTPDLEMIDVVARRMNKGILCYLSVGVTRLFAPSPDMAPMHWVQVNNFHMFDDSAWRMNKS